MSTLLEAFNCFAKSDKNAIVYSSGQTTQQCFSFKEVADISEKITKLISSHVNEKHICLGLIMNNFIYIPSIVLSLQKMNHAFVYLTSKNIDKTIIYLKLNWILSLEDTQQINLFKVIDKLGFNFNDLKLWNKISYIPPVPNFSDIFCVVETSGSTGENKIIRVTNTCIFVNAFNLRNIFQITSRDVIFWGTPLTFDPSLIELLMALISGACLLLVPYNIKINPNALYKALFDINQATILQMVPSVFLRWNEEQIKYILNYGTLKILAFGGEMFPKNILKYKKKRDLKIYNLYGITEVSCWATIHEVEDKDSEDVPIGENLEGTILEVHDENGKVIKTGIGEVFIGSASRICYINDETKLNKDLVSRETGDIAEISDRGIFLIGRKNRIIKRYGHRVSLTQIETQIFEMIKLENKCIWSEKNKKMLTFILIKNLSASIRVKTLDKIRVKLINALSEECFPDYIDIINNFPLTAHGKIDEKCLEKLYLLPDLNLNYVDIFSLLWCRHFGISYDNVDEIKSLTFMEMGGNSISAMQLLAEFRDVTKSEYPNQLVTNIFEKGLDDCLTGLRSFGSDMKRCEVDISSSSKRQKVIDRELEILWKYNLKACVDSSPIVFQRREDFYICVGSFSNIFVVLRENGEEICNIVLPDSIEGTPTVSACGNYIFVGCINGTMYCFDFMEKLIIWEYHTDAAIKSSVCFCINLTAVVFGSYDKHIYCVTIMNGSDIWKTELNGCIASSPIYSNLCNKIYVATLSGSCYCLHEENGDIIWKYSCESPIFGTPCFLNKNQFIALPEVSGKIYCLASNSGEVIWKFSTDGYIFSSVVSYKDCIIFGCHDQNIYVLNISGSEPKLLSKVTLDSEISSTPYAYNIKGTDVIVAACNRGMIYVIEFTTYNILYNLRLPNEVFSSPFIQNCKMYVGCRDNNLYCVNLDTAI